MHNKDNNYNIYVLFSNFQSKGPNSPQKVAKLKNYKVIANLHFFLNFSRFFILTLKMVIIYYMAQKLNIENDRSKS